MAGEQRGGPVVTIGTVDDASLPELAAFIAVLQADPCHHIAYLGTEPDALAEQVGALEPAGLGGTVVARDTDGTLVGVLAGEWDEQPPRVWWHGPLVRDGVHWDEVADALYETAVRLLPAHVTEHELAPDARNVRVAAFGQRHGYFDGVASAVLSRQLTSLPQAGIPGVTVRPFEDGDRDDVATLHDELFPDTHTPGRRLDVGSHRRVLVALHDGYLVGYVAAELQEDGEGYLDYLGVVADARGRGIGRALIAAVCERLATDGAGSVHLTVREDNPAARRLYTALGFDEERIVVPWRRSFSVA